MLFNTRIVSVFVFAASISFSSAETSTPLELNLSKAVHYLASEELEGRQTGSEGAKKAADYLAEILKEAKLKPGGDNDTYFQKFEFSAGVETKPEDNKLTFSGKDGESITPESGKDFSPLGFTGNSEVAGDLIFAGYGLKATGKSDKAYDSYAGLDVKDKIVLVFRYVPEDTTQERRAELNHYAGLRYKAMLARENGAKGIIVVTGPNSPGSGELVPISSDSGMSGSEIPAVSMNLATAEKLFAQAGKDLKKIQSDLDKENPHADTGFTFPNVKATLKTDVKRIRKPDNNVIGILPPVGGSDEYILIGAHYDHLGRGESGGMNRKGEENQIHYGADDNASGSAVVAELAKSLAEQRKSASADKPLRGIIIALWSGEEIGIIGSSHYAENPTVDIKKIVAYINFDMVGKLRDNKLSIQGAGSSKAWKKLLEKRNVAAGFNLNIQEDPYLPTDSTSFYNKEVPFINFFTGAHEDYHRPTDTPDKLNYVGMGRIAKLSGAVAKELTELSDRPDYIKVAKSDKGGGRDAMRIYIGSIPDYATEISGVKLSGTRKDSPADKAGLKGGDVIVEFAGKKITNIYDYTYSLDAVKIGVPVKVLILRDGTTETLSVTPEARK